jgi:hypothetical protein
MNRDLPASSSAAMPASSRLKALLTGCSALAFAAAVGAGAHADVTAGAGTTVNSSTITASSGKINMSGGTLNFLSTSKQTATNAALSLSNAIVTAAGTTNTISASTYSYTTTANPPVTGNSTFVGTLSGVISGAGNITIGAGSPIYFTGQNTYAGVTTISSGANLYIGNGNDYGSIASNSVVVSAVNNTDGTVTNGTLTFNRSDTYVYGGNITGSGVVNQAGGGTVILNGNSVLTGAAVMAQNTNVTPSTNIGYLGTLRATKGTIEIGDAAHKSASVTVPLANILAGASISGFGTLNGSLINGDDTPGTVSNRNSNTSQLVGGILTPGDGTATGTFTVNGDYTQGTFGALLITATPTSTSQLVVSGAAKLKGQISVSATNGSYAVGLYPVLKAGSVSGKFDTVLTGSPDKANALGIYYAPSGKEVDLVVAPKSIGQVYGDIVVQSFDDANSLNDIVMDHAAFDGCKDCSGWALWGRGYTSTDGVSGIAGISAFSNHAVGAIGGLDYRFASGLSFHAVLGSSTGNLGLHDKSAAAHSNETYLSLASHIPVGPVAVDAAYFFMDANSNVSRNDGYGNTLASKIANDVSGASLQISVPLMDGAVVPYGKITYSLLAAGPADEIGGGPEMLSVQNGHQTTGRYQLGLKLGKVFTLDDDVSIRPQFVLAGEANDRSLGNTSPMSMMSGNSFFAPSVSPDRFAALGRLGVEVSRHDLAVQLGLSGRKSGNQEQLMFNFGAAYRF